MIRNLIPSRPSGPCFWSVEWPDATGTFYQFTIWGKNESDAQERAEEFASQWSTYTHNPVESEKMVSDILRDYSTRTYHGD